MTIITSKANPLIKKIKKLQQKKYRQTSYLIEGWHLYEEALKYQAAILRVFVLEEFADRIQQHPNTHLVTESVLRELCDSKTPQGIVAELALPKNDFVPSAQGRYLLLEDIQDPGNLGTMIRTADAAGLDAVFISEKSADVYNQKTLRSMQGSHFHLPVIRCSLLDLVDQFNDLGLLTIATTLSQASIDYQQVGRGQQFAVIMGNEGQGISQAMVEKAQLQVHISMPGQAESLNVSVAAGILIFRLL